MRASALVFLLFGSLLAAACGGGSSSGSTDVGAPGELRALAVQGDPAPGTAGNFDILPPYPVMDAASGGWCAFVAPTTDASAPQVLYVAQPDAGPTIVEVAAVGDAAPGTTGTIAAFQGAWMCPDGTVLFLCDLSGDGLGRTFGLFRSVVAGGAASVPTAVVLDQDAPTDDLGNATAIVLGSLDGTTARKEDDGTFWFLGVDATAGDTDLFSVEADGTSFVRRAGPGDPTDNQARPGTTFATIDAFGVDPTGAYFGFAVTTALGDRRMYLRETTLPATSVYYVECLGDGDAVPGSTGTIVDAWKGGRLTVFGAGQMVWMAKGSLSLGDDVFLYFGRNSNPQYVVLARTGLTAPGTGGGTWASLDALNMASGCGAPQFDAAVNGGTYGVNRATFGVTNTAPTVYLDTADLVSSGGTLVPATYVSLRQTVHPYDETSQNGNAVVALAWSTTSALYWFVRGVGSYGVAAQGGPAPNGDTFGSFAASSPHATADGVVLFRASLATAGSGIFRQGP
jgi:hypothetical protein